MKRDSIFFGRLIVIAYMCLFFLHDAIAGSRQDDNRNNLGFEAKPFSMPISIPNFNRHQIELRVLFAGDSSGDCLFVIKNISSQNVNFVPFSVSGNHVSFMFFDGTILDECVYARFLPSYRGIELKPNEYYVYRENIDKLLSKILIREKDQKRKSNPIQLQWNVGLLGDKENRIYKSSPIFFIANYDKNKVGIRPADELCFKQSQEDKLIEAAAAISSPNRPSISARKMLQRLALVQEKDGRFADAIGTLESWKVPPGDMEFEMGRKFWIWRLQIKGKQRPVDEVRKEMWIYVLSEQMIPILSRHPSGGIWTEVVTLYQPEECGQLIKDAQMLKEQVPGGDKHDHIQQCLQQAIDWWTEHQLKAVSSTPTSTPK